MTDAKKYSLELPEVARNPHRAYREIRDNAPVTELAGRSQSGVVTLSRHDDVMRAFQTPEVEGEPLSRDDVVDIGYLFFLAGLDTVSASLECMVAFLAQNPGHRQIDNLELVW